MSQSPLLMTVYAFDSNGEGGNPAGVVLDADHLSENEMQEIATKANLSETVFVSKSDEADFKLDFFTPNKRIDDCGHATVAAFSVLKNRNPELTHSSKEIVNGVRKILLRGERVFAEQPYAKVEVEKDRETVSKSLNLAEGGWKAWIAKHDVGFLLVELNSEDELASVKPNLEELRKFSEEKDLVGAYLFVRKQDGEFVATTRMFAPAYGIDEESATGMAAGLLTSLLVEQNLGSHFIIEQGRLMNPPSPSWIFTEADSEERVVRVGGSARIS